MYTWSPNDGQWTLSRTPRLLSPRSYALLNKPNLKFPASGVQDEDKQNYILMFSKRENIVSIFCWFKLLHQEIEEMYSIAWGNLMATYYTGYNLTLINFAARLRTYDDKERRRIFAWARVMEEKKLAQKELKKRASATE